MGEKLANRIGARRRAVLKSIGTITGGLALADGVLATEAPADSPDESQVVLRQSDRCVPVRPFSGERSVEEFYDYRLPEVQASETNGGTDPGSGPYYASFGTTDLQRDGTSLLMLYDGPNGTSLVVVHDSVERGPSGGGAATFEITGLPDDGSWAVRDDYYLDPASGEIADSNYDRWQVDGSRHAIDWTWADGRTDGGAFRGLGADVSVTIDPAFNEAAALFGEHYEGRITSWQFLVPAGDTIQRFDLDVTRPVTIRTGACGGGVSPPPSAPAIRTVAFSGCGQAWVVFESAFDGTVDLVVETSAGRQQVEIARADLRRVPGRFGTHPVYRHRTRGAGKILAVSTPAGRVENDHPCARAGDEDPDADGEAPGDSDGPPDDGGSANGSRGPGDPGRGNGNADPAAGSGQGPPDDAGPNGDAGPPEGAGPPEHAGPPDGTGR